MKKHLKRRTFLRGALGGGVAAIALPALDAMMNLEQTAFADGSSSPRRYMSWFYGNGFILDRFEPIGVGNNWMLNTHMQPLAAVKDYLTVVTGLTNRSTDAITHHEGMTVWSGYTMTDIGEGAGFFSNTAGPTIDHLVSEAIAGQTPIASVHVGVSKAKSPNDNGTTMHALSHRGYKQPNNAVCNPSAVWQSLFGTFVQPKDDRELRLHILDSVKGEVDSLKSRLGPADNVRLDSHLESIAALQTKLMTAPPMCELPPDPMFTNNQAINNEMLAYTNELMSDLICYAFSCDLTRVATLLFIEGAAEPSLTEIPGNNNSWHEYSHNTGSWYVGGPFDNGQIYMMQRFAYLLERMRNTMEIDGSNLLDNSLVLLSSDSSDGSIHSIRRQPMVIAGHGSGHLKYPGIHYQPEPLSGNYSYGNQPGPSSGNTADVLLSILQAFDPAASQIGEQGGAGSSTPLTEILA
jgi:hypothetical protein